MENLDGTVIVTALPTMARAFDVTVTQMSAGVSSYLLALAMLIPASGWCADRYGARRIFSLAIALFTLASIACAASTSLGTFIAARLFQGAAGAMMVPVGRLAVLRNTPKPKLIEAIATISWPGLAAPVIGPPIGGFIVTHTSWPWIFLLNVPLGILGFILALKLLPTNDTLIRRPFDWPGFLLTGTSFVLIMVGLEWLGQGRSGLSVWLPLIGGFLLAFISYRYALKVEHPILDLRAMRLPTYAATIRSGSAFRAAVASMPFLLPLLLQLGLGLNPFHAGLLLLVLFAGNLTMKPFTTPLLRRYRFRTILIANGLLTAATFCTCACLSQSTPLIAMVPLFFIAGMSRSMQFTCLNTMAFADVPQEQMSGANTLFNTMFQLAMGMGVALGALFLHLASFGTRKVPIIADFRVAFLLMGMICLVSLLEFARLDPASGDVVRTR